MHMHIHMCIHVHCTCMFLVHLCPYHPCVYIIYTTTRIYMTLYWQKCMCACLYVCIVYSLLFRCR